MFVDKRNAIALAKLRELHKINNQTQFSNALLLLLSYFILKNEVNEIVINIWIIISILIIMIRGVVTYNQKKFTDSKNSIRDLNYYRLGILASGFMWGIATIIIYPQGNLENIFYFIFILMGVTSGSLIVHSIDLKSALIYPITILIPLIYSLIGDDLDKIFPMLVGTSLYLIFVLINTKNISQDRENYLAFNYELILREKEKAASEERYKLLLNHSPIGIVHYDMNLEANYYNEQFINIMGIDQEKFITINLSDIKDQNPIKAAKASLKGKMTKYNGIYEMTFKKKLLWINFLSSPVKDKENNIIGGVSIIQDITEQKDAENKIKKLAFYDPLTQLPNRRMLIDKLNTSLELTKQASYNGAIMFLDLDNFKTLNDTLGHDFGDVLLKKVAQRLKFCVKNSDTVARIGGDEFVVLLNGFENSIEQMQENAQTIAKRLLETINEPFELIGNKKYTTSVSIGVVVFGENLNTNGDILKHADIAMYQAKQSGRNNIKFFDKSMQIDITNKVSAEIELKEAIKNKEFVLYFQPQVNEKTKIFGVEALVRWKHPKKGLVYPIDFIKFAEETGLIIEIGKQVLDMAFQQIVKWKNISKMKDISISVNISAIQFKEKNFIKYLLSLVDIYQIDTSLFKIEITEGTLLDCSNQMIQNMLDIREKGINFSLDDFGTGYSSLSYLKKLPISELKIDRTFVEDIIEDSNDIAIVETILAFSKNFGYKVIAEGVETFKQKELLSHLGCHMYQGYLFAKAIPSDELEKIVEENEGFVPINNT